jgi:hypothetical protein
MAAYQGGHLLLPGGAQLTPRGGAVALDLAIVSIEAGRARSDRASGAAS